MRLLIPLLLAALAWPGQAQDTILRHDNYLAFIGKTGATAGFAAKSLPRTAYVQDLGLLVLDSRSQEVGELTVPLGTAAQWDVPLHSDGLHVLCVSTGWPMATVRRTSGPFALVAWDQTPVNLCGGFARHFFFVPKGLSRFEIGVSADVTGEGARLGVWRPDGQAALELEDDFDKLQRLKVDVPAGSDGQAWALTLEKPQKPGLILDDVLLWLGRGLPPFLCEHPEWLPEFVGTAPLEQISLRVPLGSRGLGEGKTLTLRFDLPAAVPGQMAALRAVAQDVDYPTEGTFTLNGGEPYALPLTGDGTAMAVTVMLRREDLKAGANVLECRHDNRASSALGLSEMEIVIGDQIQAAEAW